MSIQTLVPLVGAGCRNLRDNKVMASRGVLGYPGCLNVRRKTFVATNQSRKTKKTDSDCARYVPIWLCLIAKEAKDEIL